MIPGAQIKEPKTGDIMIYHNKRCFIYESETPGKFLKAVDGSYQLFLETGKFYEFMAAKSCCRFATPEEIADYKKLIEQSRHSKHLNQLELI